MLHVLYFFVKKIKKIKNDIIIIKFYIFGLLVRASHRTINNQIRYNHLYKQLVSVYMWFTIRYIYF